MSSENDCLSSPPDRNSVAGETAPPLPAVISPLDMNVLLAGKLTGMAAPGGGEVQLQAMARELPQVGVNARLWRPWEESLSAIHCLHLFGSEPEHLSVVEVARQKGIPVVLSPIAWFDLASCWRDATNWRRRGAACTKFLVRSALPKLPSWRRRLYQAVDLLLPNSQAEAEQLIRYFGVPADRIRVVPNGAERRFASPDSQPFIERIGYRDFILYAGRIEPRKNQLGFLRAMQGVVVPIVVLGNVVPGQQAYARACRRAAGPNVQFQAALNHDDPLLASAYAACGCLALTSWYETPGLVALEAAMSGTPLVLPRGGCAREYFGGLASYVSPSDVEGIRRAVLDALTAGRSQQLASLVREHFTWRTAAWVTREAYELVA
ncbi:MAG TPA: glycosyltransferase [Pirellulales bacterium]|jgi:glycosyltransferase involved in cell wall biosynthesis|nr:glycosyltransferase [Pirellulales bacterium]